MCYRVIFIYISFSNFKIILIFFLFTFPSEYRLSKQGSICSLVSPMPACNHSMSLYSTWTAIFWPVYVFHLRTMRCSGILTFLRTFDMTFDMTCLRGLPQIGGWLQPELSCRCGMESCRIPQRRRLPLNQHQL